MESERNGGPRALRYGGHVTGPRLSEAENFPREPDKNELARKKGERGRVNGPGGVGGG
jgi:hypothetical protein